MNEARGFIFLMIATGIGSFISIIATGFALSDRESYAGYMVAVSVVLVLVFLVSGFLGFSGANLW